MRASDVVEDRFEIERLAGSGGMGDVYRARDRRSGETVALKVIQGANVRDLSRLSREAEALVTLRLPGVVQYVAHGMTATGQPYLAMEWLDGITLDARLAQGPLSIAESVMLVARVAETLGAVHQLGIHPVAGDCHRREVREEVVEEGLGRPEGEGGKEERSVWMDWSCQRSKRKARRQK